VRGEQVFELWRQFAEDLRIDRALAFRDINRDGKTDVPYAAWFGGNYAASFPARMVSIADDGFVEDINFVLDTYATPLGAEDIDGDDVYEWWALDEGFLRLPFSHADSP